MLHDRLDKREAARKKKMHDGKAARRRLTEENARFREALEIIAGERKCGDSLLGNSDVARIALHGK